MIFWKRMTTGSWKLKRYKFRWSMLQVYAYMPFLDLFVCTFCRRVLILLRATVARPCSTWSMGSRSDGKFGPGGNLLTIWIFLWAETGKQACNIDTLGILAFKTASRGRHVEASDLIPSSYWLRNTSELHQGVHSRLHELNADQLASIARSVRQSAMCLHVSMCLDVSRCVSVCPLLASDDMSQNRIQVNCGAPSSSITFPWKQVSSCLARSLGYLQPEVPEVSRQILDIFIHPHAFMSTS